MRQQHDLIQGSEEWHKFRLEHFGASEAAAMLGISKHVKRDELLHMKHTGIAKEYSTWVQDHILDNGHVTEALARPMAEEIIREELYPAIFSDGKLSASCDGLTMSGDIAFEHKQWNEALAKSVRERNLPDEHMPQCQQVLAVTRAARLLFMVSDGTPEKRAYMWVSPDDTWFKKIAQGWAQFAEDLANYQPQQAAPEPVAAAIETIPALTVQVEGRVLTTNLDQFALTAKNFIANIKTEISTDQDFADAEKMTKFLKDGEDKLELVKTQALSQTADIDALFRTIDSLKEEMRAKRLMLSKIVDNRKVSIRVEIQESGNKAVREHLDALNKRLGKPYMPDKKWADFVTAMRGKKTITSLRSAVNDEIARFKIDANEIADRIQTNLNSLRDMADGFQFLFADTAQIVLKQNDDLVALIKTRIAEHKESEAAKKERERLAQEELQRRATAEQERIATAANAVLAKAVEDTVVVGDISSNVGALSIAPGKVEIIPGTSIYNMPVAAPDEAQMMRTAGEMLDDILVNMHITNIRRRDARRIAELLGGGAVVWENGRCYPTSEACCTIVLAERTPNLASARK